MQNKPLARYENIVVQDLENEILVCDLNDNRVLCLNNTAGEVWKLCDGEKDTSQISEILSKKFRASFTEEMVLLSLDKLNSENLLQSKLSNLGLFRESSRRDVIRRIGLASMIALPIISSVVMPTALQAASAGSVSIGNACSSTPQCQSGLFCVDGVCCNSSCTGLCQSCNLAGRVGTCSFVPNGQDPDGECGGAAITCNGTGACTGGLGTVCTLASECQSGFCVNGYCCNSSCSGVCQACDFPGFHGICRTLPPLFCP
ncbi:MAG: PqqD family protein [Pyrinomonadaceae bacterium]|nr:PqqD family protein [Pyrinomonadaceae bacterium]